MVHGSWFMARGSWFIIRRSESSRCCSGDAAHAVLAAYHRIALCARINTISYPPTHASCDLACTNTLAPMLVATLCPPPTLTPISPRVDAVRCPAPTPCPIRASITTSSASTQTGPHQLTYADTPSGASWRVWALLDGWPQVLDYPHSIAQARSSKIC